MSQLVRQLVRRAGDPGSNPGPGENFFLKLLISYISDADIFFVLTELKIFRKTKLFSGY